MNKYLSFMMHLKNLFFICSVSFGLTACQSMSLHPSPLAASEKNWTAEGKIGLTSPAQNGSASLYWAQNNNNYTVRLFGPLGIGAVTLQGTPEKAIFTNQAGQIFTASSPEQLLKQNTTWNIPLSNLRYWIRAQPAPNLPAEKKYNQTGQLIYLAQQGWKINYIKYNNNLPKLISLQQPSVQLKVFIDQWY